MEQQYTYYAFVSYRSSDEKWAKWLQEKIEGYRLPTTIQHENTCSPRSAQSPWVGAEIDTFVELGRRDRIIPVIVEGRPYSDDPATECYNPSLLKHFPHSDDINQDREILGVNIHEEGSGSAYMKRERAVMQVVSRMLNVSFDRIWQRQKRRIIRRTIFSVIGALLVLASLIAVWIMNQPFDSRVMLYESSPAVEALPPMHNAVVTLTLPDEERTDTICSFDEEVLFRYLPARLKNQEVAVHVEAPDYLPLDTIVMLNNILSLPLARDPQVYGSLSAVVLVNGNIAPSKRIMVENFDITTDAAGRFTLFIPLEQQKKSYFITDPADASLSTTLHAPCGRNDIILL